MVSSLLNKKRKLLQICVVGLLLLHLPCGFAQNRTAPTSVQAQSASAANCALPPEIYAKAVAYSHARYRHYFVNAIYAVVILWLVLVWRLGPKYRDWAERVSRRRFVQGLIFTPLLIFTISLLALPTDAWDHWLSHRYGLSVQSWGSYFADWAKAQAIFGIAATVLVLILYAVVRRSPRRWWFYFWLATLPVIVFAIFIEPIVVEPLFFKFEPLQAAHPELVEKLEEVVHRAGMKIPPQRMYEMKASSKTTALNAYVAGFGASKRVVVYDTLLAKSSDGGVLLTFGHEMGHYVLHHIAKEFAIDSLVLLLLFYVGFRLVRRMIGRWSTRWGIRDLGDWASLPVLILALNIVGFFGEPVLNTISRHFEHEADRYGMEVVHGIVPNENQVAAQDFQIDGEINLDDPDPNSFIRFWLYDHPSLPERIAFASTYNPWNEGKPPKYVK